MAQFTKKAIMLSFLKLLNERPLNKITVRDIVEDCGVSRNSFYYYYQDVYALLDDIFQQETQKAMVEPLTGDNWQGGLVRALQFAMVNKRMLYNAFHSVSRERVEEYLYAVSEKVMMEFVDQQAAGLSCTEEDKRFVAHFYKYALVGMFLEWVNSGMQADLKGNIELIGHMFEGNIRQALERSAGGNLDK